MVCCSCGAVVTKQERFNDLSIDLPRRKKESSICSVQDSLDLFFKASVPLKSRLFLSVGVLTCSC